MYSWLSIVQLIIEISMPNHQSALNFLTKDYLPNPLPQTTEPETSSHYDTVTETENQTATEQENNDSASSSSDTETESSASEPDSVIKNPDAQQNDDQE